MLTSSTPSEYLETSENLSKVGEQRYEIKLRADHFDMPRVMTLLRLHSVGFSTSYPQRRVNNIYFDTPDLSSVEENLAGISVRRKMRLRWYGDTTKIVRGTWEIKCKVAGLGWKITQPMEAEISLQGTEWKDVLKILWEHSSDTISAQLRLGLVPTLINYYSRRYFESRDGYIRATVDFEQTFFDQRFSSSPNLKRRLLNTDGIIVELKAAPDQFDLLAKSVQQFPLRVTRNSKYMTGILLSIN